MNFISFDTTDAKIEALLTQAKLEVTKRVQEDYEKQVQRRDKFTKIYNRK